MKRRKRKTYQSWPCVFEVSDAAGPRRFPGMPRVCVKPKCSKPGRALERWFSVSGKVEKKKLVSIRYDLMPGENNKGGSNNPFYLPKEKAEETKANETSCASAFLILPDITVMPCSHPIEKTNYRENQKCDCE